jgi:hypothetical protein
VRPNRKTCGAALQRPGATRCRPKHGRHCQQSGIRNQESGIRSRSGDPPPHAIFNNPPRDFFQQQRFGREYFSFSRLTQNSPGVGILESGCFVRRCSQYRAYSPSPIICPNRFHHFRISCIDPLTIDSFPVFRFAQNRHFPPAENCQPLTRAVD